LSIPLGIVIIYISHKVSINLYLLLRNKNNFYTVLLCKELALTHVILEGDAKHVVGAIASKGNSWSQFGHLMEDTMTILRTCFYIMEVRSC
jgi:hypothetical protein